jgi:hypothetical protein
MAKKEDVMGTGIGARPPAMQPRKPAMAGRMQEPKRLQYGAQQNMRQNMPQYGAMQNMQPQYGGMQNMQPGAQPPRPVSDVMPPNWQQQQPPRPISHVMPPNWQTQPVQQPRPASDVMPGDWQQPQQRRFAMTVMPGDWQQQPALMQMMMQRK